MAAASSYSCTSISRKREAGKVAWSGPSSNETKVATAEPREVLFLYVHRDVESGENRVLELNTTQIGLFIEPKQVHYNFL